MAIVDGDSGTEILKEQIEKLFKVVDILEEEQEDIVFSKKETDLNSFEIGRDKIEHNIDVIMEKNEKQKEKYGSNINVNGKNCFYYAKNICLCQKKYVLLLMTHVNIIFLRSLKNY